MKVERFWHPLMVTNYYDRSIFLSPWFLLLTAIFFLLAMKAYHHPHNWWVLALIVSGWIHLIVQHRWFKSSDPEVLRRNASKTTLALSVLYVVTVGILLSFIH